MYGSSRLGIQKPVSMDSHAVPNFVGIASAGTGRELVHIEFNGSWSSYEVNYADTSNTTITTYQMSYEYYSLTRGEKNYELVSHVSNAMVIISDKKLKVCTGDTVNYYTADILQTSDYYAFHATMSGRTYTASNSSYRFGGSNGQEKDNEIFAGAYSAEYWEYDSRLGRRWNVDPIIKFGESPYASFANNPIWLIDPNGMDTSFKDEAAKKDFNETYKEIGERMKKVEEQMEVLKKQAQEKRWSDKKLNKKLEPLKSTWNNLNELKVVMDDIINKPIVFEYSTDVSLFTKDQNGNTQQIDPKRVLINFRAGNKAALVHENRHGWGVLKGEISGSDGYDYQDEFEAYRHQGIYDRASYDQFISNTAKEEYPNASDVGLRELYDIKRAIEFKYKNRVQYQTWIQKYAN
jgi:RHS repeat-associated protein